MHWEIPGRNFSFYPETLRPLKNVWKKKFFFFFLNLNIQLMNKFNQWTKGHFSPDLLLPLSHSPLFNLLSFCETSIVSGSYFNPLLYCFNYNVVFIAIYKYSPLLECIKTVMYKNQYMFIFFLSNLVICVFITLNIWKRLKGCKKNVFHFICVLPFVTWKITDQLLK